MIRFAFPNVLGKKDFAGLVRYIARKNDEDKLFIDDIEWTKASDNFPNARKVKSAALVFNQNKPKKRPRIYENKDENRACFGHSQHLAYLLALINSVYESKWDFGNDMDIWCTGEIKLRESNTPNKTMGLLSDVDPDAFLIKVNHFLASDKSKDRLFIVPVLNMDGLFSHDDLKKKNTRLLSVDDIGKMTDKQIFEKKTILQVNRNELSNLIYRLFVITEPDNLKRKAVIVASILCLATLIAFTINWYRIDARRSPNHTLKEWTEPITGMEFVYIPDGCFKADRTGNPANDFARKDEVCLDGYWIGKYEVTQSQWRIIMGTEPSDNKACDSCPVEMVSWEMVQHFLRGLNEKTTGGFRLPTETEWEYACRGGPLYALEENHQNVALHRHNTKLSEPVEKSGSNTFGIHGMLGNVREWSDNLFPKNGIHRSVRGGSWLYDRKFCRCDRRKGIPPLGKSKDLGFRLVKLSEPVRRGIDY